MQAIRIHENGDAKQLKFEEAPVPEPKDGEVRVKVAATGLNFIEIYQRRGQYQASCHLHRVANLLEPWMPLVVGNGVSRWGCRRNRKRYGGYAEYAVAPRQRSFTYRRDITGDGCAVMLRRDDGALPARTTYPEAG